MTPSRQSQIVQILTPFVSREEACVLHPYLDSLGYPTIGWGSRFYPDGSQVSMSDLPITQQTADYIRDYFLDQLIDQVDSLVRQPTTVNQMAALCDLTYNIGIGQFRTSTVLCLLNSGDYSGASTHMADWVKGHVDGKLQTIPDLVARRGRDQMLWSTPDQSPPVQVVVKTDTPTIRATGGAVGTTDYLGLLKKVVNFSPLSDADVATLTSLRS